ncbi:MAG TPA: NAD-dependent protein deacylase [bacterium]|nr:NAD-dependent protein deacylase [bacterium]
MSPLEKAVEFIKSSNNIVAFTGAGASTESNIPDFRSDQGLYSKEKEEYGYPPEVMLSHSFFMRHPDKFYTFYKKEIVHRDAEPNPCHLALAKLEEIGKLKTIITQNIDGLHQRAGSRNVLELHGTIHKNYCLSCGKFFDLNYILDSKELVPKCDECNGIIRPDIVLYEEPLDSDVLNDSVTYISEADCLIVIGTSLVVYPAAALIDYYKQEKMIIIINKTPTPYDWKASVIIRDNAGVTLKKILKELGIWE